MLKLKSRSESIPGGFLFLQAETGWESPRNASFNKVVDALVSHRLGNKWLVQKHGWNTDWNSVADEVESYNALRMQGNSKWQHFIGGDDGGPPGTFFQFPRPGPLQSAAGTVKRVVAGVKVLTDWLGSSGRAVEKELAEKRANVCAICPQNKDGDWTTFFTAPVSEMLKLQLGIKNDLRLSTSKDDVLHVCMACSCPLKLKVWTPIRHIVDNMDEGTKSRLQPDSPVCWIISEQVEAR